MRGGGGVKGIMIARGRGLKFTVRGDLGPSSGSKKDVDGSKYAGSNAARS